MNDKKTPITIFWFRRDLRLDDNHGLYQALKKSNSVLPVFIFDKNILNNLSDKQDLRVNFIYNTLEALNTELKAKGSSLLVLHNEPLKAFEYLCSKFAVKEVVTNEDYEPYAIERDAKVAAFLKTKNCLFASFKDQVVFAKDEITKADSKPYTIFTPYSKVWKAKLNEQQNHLPNYPSEKLNSNYYKTKPFEFLSLKQIGFAENAKQIPLSRINEEIIQNYHETRNFPYLIGTSNLSVHLRFGTLSIRQLSKFALKTNEQWLNELIWREFFMNILFHFPKVVTHSFKPKYDNITWRNNEKEFELWCKGETGYPIVDAGMREVNETGLMHNRVRMIVASFLTKHLLIDWRWGEAYFAEKLLDYDLSANNGNWQWAAGCGCDAAPYFRIFNPYEQVKRFDPDLIYIQKWVKNLNELDYPNPIVEHKFARERVLKEFKKALGEN